jgi:outer membrane immunogenic protein
MRARTFVFFVIFALILLIVVPALRAQSTSKPPEQYTFRGFYVGVNGGGSWASTDNRFTPLPDATTFGALSPTKLSPDPTGGFGGGQVGYNWQFGRLVLGLEADIQGGNVEGLTTVTPIVMNNGASAGAGTFLLAHHDMSYFGTVRPRVGVVGWKRFLFYGTGGLAYGHVNWTATTDYSAQFGPVYTATADEIRAGWTAGGGVEALVTQHWTVRGEYLYYDLGGHSVIANGVPAIPPNQVGYAQESKGHLFRVGLSYRW